MTDTLYIAWSGTNDRGYCLGDTLVSIHVARLWIAALRPRRTILSMAPVDRWNHLWHRTVRECGIEVEPEAVDPNARPAGLYAAFDERRAERKTARGVPFDAYRELYRRLDGGQRQHALCGGERGLGRRNIFEYFWCGQEGDPEPPADGGTRRYAAGEIDRPAAGAGPGSAGVFVAPWAKCQGNDVFTPAFWRSVVRGLLRAGVRVTVNDGRGVFDDLVREGAALVREPVDVARHIAAARCVVCGNTGVGWLAGALGVPLFAGEFPGFSMGDYRYRECGVESLVAVYAAPDVGRWVGEIVNFYHGRPLTMRALTDWEPWIAACLPARGRHAVDVGANAGTWTHALAERFERVTAIEPDPRSAAELRTVCGERVTILEAAAWINDGPLPFVLYDNPQRTWSAVAVRDVHRGRPEAGPTIEVAGRALDGLRLEQVDFVKVDVEGAEVQVLAGATRLIERDRPRLLVEIHEPENLAWCETWLRRAGYDTTLIHGSGYRPGQPGWAEHCWLSAKHFQDHG